MNTHHSQSGFTLIELMVVVGIIGLLSSLAVITLAGQRVRSRDARRIADISEIITGVDSYYAINGAYPLAPGDDCSDKNTGCTIDRYLGGLVSTGILKKLPQDPYPAYTNSDYTQGRCANYAYKTPGTADGSSFPANLEYRVAFGAEMAGVSGKHPLNSNISTGTLSGCGSNPRGEAWVDGPRK